MLPLFARELHTSAVVSAPRPLQTSVPIAAPAAATHQRRVSAGLVSVVLHLVAASVAVYLQQVAPIRTARAVTPMPPQQTRLVYVPRAPVEILTPIRSAPTPAPPAKVEVRSEEPLPELPKPLPIRTVENRRPDIAPPAASLTMTAPPKPVPATPAPAVTVGAFANSAVVRTPEPKREMEKVGFDTRVERTTQPKPAETAVGGFDRPVDRDARSQRPADTIVTESGFGRTAAATRPATESSVVRETGFGNTNSQERPRAAKPQTPTVAQTGFATAREAQIVSKQAPPPAPRLVPVEVLSKPTPAYTDEARKLKIEGEVVLEVDFIATGSVRVVRVVRGLGHGLDEAAARAAEQIRFKPARDDGHAVDFRTTVHIVFRLA